ncbi:MAG: ABC transporter permease [Thermomicrobiales bacterium]
MTASTPAAPAPTALSDAASRNSVRKSPNGWQIAVRRFRRQKLAMVGLVIVTILAIAGFGAPILAPTSYQSANLMEANQFPSREHWMGTDTIGHDFLSRVMYGTRTSLIVGIAAVAVSFLIGIPLGLIAGLKGGMWDFAIMRLV